MITTPAGAPAIETHELVRAFKDTRAVDGVDISIPAGEIYGFLGPNGAGKTTTVRMLCTLLRPTSGVARVAGFDVAERPTAVRMSIGVALQEASLDLGQTGRELLELQARLFSLPRRCRAQAHRRARHAGRHRRRPRSARGDLQRRHAPPARPRAGAGPRAATSSSLTSPPRVSTRSVGARCGTRSAASTPSAASPCS